MAKSLDDLANRIESTYELFQALIRRMEQHENARASMNRGAEEISKQARATREMTAELHDILGSLREVVSVLRRSDPENTTRMIQSVRGDLRKFQEEVKSQNTAVTEYRDQAISGIQGARNAILGRQQRIGNRVTFVVLGTAIILVLEVLRLFFR